MKDEGSASQAVMVTMMMMSHNNAFYVQYCKCVCSSFEWVSITASAIAINKYGLDLWELYGNC